MQKNKLKFSDNCIEVACERGDVATPMLLANITPIHSNRLKTEFRLSIYNTPEVLHLMRGVSVDNIAAAPQKIQQYYHREMQARIAVEDLLNNGPMHDDERQINEHITLMRHQQVGREIARYRDRYAFFYDTRTGKTPLSLAIIHDDLVANPGHKWLVVCPLILIDNAWLEDTRRFFPDLSVVSCHAATPAARLKAIQSEASLYITNVESFVNYREFFEAKGFNGCIVDESSTMKSTSSKISKALVEFAQTMKKFYLLSGTPAPNGEWEYYMQLKAIDYFGTHQSYAQFKDYYFVNISFSDQYAKLAVRSDRKDALYTLIKRLACFIDKEEVLTTPGRTFHEVEITLPADLKKRYNKMKNELFVEMQEELQIMAGSAAAKLNKLNQLSSGFIMDTQAIKENKFYGDTKQEIYMFDTFRFDKLEELLASPECAGEQVLIWANYREEFRVIKERLGDTCRCIYGGTSIEEKNEAIRLFKSGKIQYLVANPASADKGLTLTNTHIAIYFSLNWSYELFKQSMERIYGSIKSQPKHCHYYIIIAKGTVDRVLYSDVLQGKGDASYAVLNHLKPAYLLQ